MPSCLSLFLAFFLPSLVVASPLKVTVSVPPIKCIVENIGQERVAASVVVPGGTSPHSYEPKGKQTVALADTEMFVCVGESFEERLLTHLSAVNPKMVIVDLRKCVDLLYSSCECHHYDIDPHLWLSPKQTKNIAIYVYQCLCEHDPEGIERYNENFSLFMEKIEDVNNLAENSFASIPSRSFVTAHAAFGYLCRDYNLTQLSLENNGKSATPKTLVALVERAKNDKVRVVLAQPQYNSKGAIAIANDLNAKLFFIDPYREDVLANLTEIISALCLKK